MTHPAQEEAIMEAPTGLTCAGCQKPIDEDSTRRTPLCPECREQLIRYPIPRSIQLFGIGILVIMVIGFFSFPKNFAAGIHLKKGKQAAEQHRYQTAQREFAQVVAKYPNHLEAQARLLMAAYYNLDFETFSNTFEKIKSRPVDDRDLYNDVDQVLFKAADYFPADSISQLAELYGGQMDSLPLIVLEAYSYRHPDQAFPMLTLARRFFSDDEFNRADLLLNQILSSRSDFAAAINLKLAVKRELRQFDSAYYYVDRLLSINKENPFALGARARIQLSEKKDKEALQTALQAHQLDQQDGYAAASLALAYHFNGQLKERDALITQARSDSAKAEYFTYVNDILTGKETLAR